METKYGKKSHKHIRFSQTLQVVACTVQYAHCWSWQLLIAYNMAAPLQLARLLECLLWVASLWLISYGFCFMKISYCSLGIPRNAIITGRGNYCLSFMELAVPESMTWAHKVVFFPSSSIILSFLGEWTSLCWAVRSAEGNKGFSDSSLPRKPKVGQWAG